MELFKVADTNKKVEDSVLAAFLAEQGIDRDGVELTHDYALRSEIKGCSPYGKVYTDLNSDRKFLVVSGLPMVDAYGQPHELSWRDNNGVIESGNNIYHAVLKGLDTRLVALSAQPGSIDKDAEVSFRPRLFIGESEVPPLSLTPQLLETDPVNGNYHNNVLEWDYGVCTRRVRLIEGRLLGAWVFLQNPRATVRIKYNQSGDYRLKLGMFRANDDEEIIPAAAFENPPFGYPFTVSDTATFYPDAHAETSSVDGFCGQWASSDTWPNIHGASGNFAVDSDIYLTAQINADSTANRFYGILRSPVLFPVSLPGSVTITAATLSLYGYLKADPASWGIKANIFACNPASNTAVAAADFAIARWGSTPFSTDITYTGYLTGSGGNPETYRNDFALNAGGLAGIPLSGVAKFGFRESVYDAPDSAPAWSSSVAAYFGCYSAEQGTGYKPKLVVTYSPCDPKYSSDAATAFETVSDRSLVITNSGSALEIGLVAASVLAGDTARGNEVGGLQKTITGVDTGHGVDTLAVAAQKTGSDTILNNSRGEVGIPNKEVSL